MYGDTYVWTPYVSYICTVYYVDNKYHLSAVMYGQLCWLFMYILLLHIYCCWFVDCRLLHIICFWPVALPLTARLVWVVLFSEPNFSFPFSWRLFSQCAGLLEMIKFSEISNLAEMSADFQEVISLFSNFQSLASCNPNRGDTTLFWTDKWTGQNQNQAFKDLYPQLYSFSKKQKCSL